MSAAAGPRNAQNPAAAASAAAAAAAGPTAGPDTVHVLYQPAGTPTCDVLFFHGLQPVSYDQAWKRTWENADGVLWPAEWLGKQDFPTARVMSISYDSRAYGGTTDLDAVADILVNEICMLAKVGQDCPVVLVGHSLGGLVLKKLALQAHKEAFRERSIQQKRCKAFCDNLAGAFFYATPHGGASMGSFAKTVLGGVSARGSVVEYLTVFSKQGAELNRDFMMTFPTLCFMALVETEKYRPLGLALPGVQVVAEGSAMQGMRNYVRIEADHINICKPESTDDATYRYLKEYLDAALKNLQKRQEALVKVVQQPLPTALDVGNKVGELQTRYTKEVQPAMTWISKQRAQLEDSLGDRWAEGLFPPDKSFDELEVIAHKNVLKDYWNHVLDLCDKGVLDDSFFKQANMAGRAQEYRLLVEPVQIANYYHANRHLDKPHMKSRGHYIDGITVELEDDNNIRPGRFLKLQRIEQRVFGSQDPTYTAPSSLGLARLLKERVGSRTWAEYKTQPEQGAEPEPEPAPSAAAGNDDSPAEKDSLRIKPIATGTAAFLLDPQTAAATMAVYARWGSGKSSFMKLVEAEMLMKAAQIQLDAMQLRHNPPPARKSTQGDKPTQADDEAASRWLLAERFDELKTRHASRDAKALSADDWRQLKALASPRLLTVWFNSWQYLNEEQVWSGLVVEVTQRLEEKLGHKQRRLMRGWWIISPWDFLRLLLVPMRLLAGLAYNWKARRTDVVLRCILPSVLVLLVVGACMGFGIWELQQQAKAKAGSAVAVKLDPNTASEELPINKSAAAAIAAAGVITSLLAPFLLAITQCKQMSDQFIAARSHVRFADHSAKIGYQHAVIKDLHLLKVLLGKALKPFNSDHPSKGCWGSLAAPWRALLRSVTKAVAYLLLCCCGCCLGRSNKRVLQNSLLHVKQSPTETEPRIVVFIDDLDRCKPTKIIEVLEAINLVLAGSGFVVVVGMDKAFITSAIQSAYKDINIMTNEDKAVEFLEKIVQVELTLPTPASAEMLEFLKDQGVQHTPGAAVPDEEVSSSPPIAAVMQRVEHAAAGPAASSAPDPMAEQAQQVQEAQEAREAREAAPAVNRLKSRVNDAKRDAASAQRAARAAAEAAQEVAQKCGAMSGQATTARHFSMLAHQAVKEARQQAHKASEQSTTAQSQFQQSAYSSALTAASAGQQAVDAAEQAARDARVAQQRVAEVRESALKQLAAAQQRGQYSVEESALICFLHRVDLLFNATPRDVKRMLNRYLLAKQIMLAAYQLRQPVKFDGPELLAWVVLWWKYPLAMCALMKLQGPASQPDQAGATRKLVDLLQQVQWQQQGHNQGEDSTAGSSSTPSRPWWLPMLSSAKQQLDAAGAAAAAKQALAAAHAKVAAAIDDAAKKEAEKALKEAETKLQLAELWGLCNEPEGTSGPEQLRAILNLKTAVMHHPVYRLFASID